MLGGFLILPALYCLQKLIDEFFWRAVRNGVALAIIFLAVLLSSSRAAWGILALTSVALVALNFLTTTSHLKKIRIFVLVMLVAALGVATLSVLLSFDSVANIFKERANLFQSYDPDGLAASAGISSAPKWRWTTRLESARCSSTATFRKTRTIPSSMPSCPGLAERSNLSGSDLRDVSACAERSARRPAVVASLEGRFRCIHRPRSGKSDYRHRSLAALFHGHRGRLGVSIAGNRWTGVP